MKCPVCNEEVTRIPSHFKKSKDKLHIDFLNKQYEIGKKHLFAGKNIFSIRQIDEIVLKSLVEGYLYENFKEKIQENGRANRNKNVSKAMKKETSKTSIYRNSLQKLLDTGIEGIDYVVCQVCGSVKAPSIVTHISRIHKITGEEYKERFPNYDFYSLNYRKKQSDRMLENNPNNNPDTIKKMKETKAGTKDERSQKRKEMYANEEIKLSPLSGKAIGGFRKDIGHYTRSTWEANVARILQYQGIEYVYEKEPFVFRDENGEIIDSYLPDFYLPKSNMFLEVKGQMDETSIRKIKLLFEHYLDIKYMIIDGSVYSNMERGFRKKLGKMWEYQKRNLRRNPELYET